MIEFENDFFFPNFGKKKNSICENGKLWNAWRGGLVSAAMMAKLLLKAKSK